MNENLYYYFNKVEGLTAVCRTNNEIFRGDAPELEVGKEYHVSFFSVLRSSSDVILEEFGTDYEFNSTLFDYYLNGVKQKMISIFIMMTILLHILELEKLRRR